VPDAGADDLRRIASAVRDRVGAGPGVVVLGSEAGGKAAMVALLTADLAGAGAAARDVLARAAKAVGGGAGGKGDLASAGGRDPSQLAEALRIARADAMVVLAGGTGKGSMG
jgi:alanyl-tRNA synthetase